MRVHCAQPYLRVALRVQAHSHAGRRVDDAALGAVPEVIAVTVGG